MRPSLCAHPMRFGGGCKLSAGHRGPHAAVVFTCDGCGEVRRGHPHAYGQDGEYPRGLAFCFLCTGKPAERAYWAELLKGGRCHAPREQWTAREWAAHDEYMAACHDGRDEHGA